ncbi:MAG: putative toxin-antitoxin system toxin component, PIN family [Lautropia sp.]|nr:putative toxin-antitoxin system toxin component, PIN family [Lautropia sp.]
MKIKRAVVDTNVLISAALSPRSVPASLVDLLLQHGRLVFSAETYGELETRLWRQKFDRYLSIEQRRLILQDLAAVADWVDLPEFPRAVYCRDPDDDIFIHTALEADVDVLITGDQDLLVLANNVDVAILSPFEALQWISQEQVTGGLP